MVDLYAYDYDNVPVWLREWSKSPAGQAIKPFAVWPYKYSKQVLRMAGDVFDRTIPWQDRVAKLMALTTLVALYGLFGWKRREEQVTPQGDETTPSWLSPKGRLSIGVDPEGREIFVRTAKYPFLGLTDAGVNLIQGQTEASLDSVQDTLGGLGPMGQLGVLGMGYINRRSQYTPKDVIIGDALASFMPFYRTLQNVSNSLDLYPRKKEDWRQSFGSVVPTTDPNLQDLLHGSKRTIKVPVEGSVKRTPGTKKSRTTVSIIPEREREDVLLYALTGISVSRIDPEHAKAYEIRREKNLEKKAKEAMKNIKR
jgi:hypothetical protein